MESHRMLMFLDVQVGNKTRAMWHNVTSDFLGCCWRDLSKNNTGVQLYTETSGTETNQETTMMLVACDQAGISKIWIYLGHHQRRWKTYINPSTINLPSTSYPPSVWPPKWENLKTKCHPQSKQLSFPWCCWWNLTVLTSSAHLTKAHINTCKCIYIYAFVNIYIYVYIYIYMCVYICIYIYIDIVCNYVCNYVYVCSLGVRQNHIKCFSDLQPKCQVEEQEPQYNQDHEAQRQHTKEPQSKTSESGHQLRGLLPENDQK